MVWFDFVLKQWKAVILAFVTVDLLVIGGLVYLFTAHETSQAVAAEPSKPAATATSVPTDTPWPGPGKRVTPTPTSPPTRQPTEVLAQSGFPIGFTPTPRPTREQVKITLPYVYPIYRNNLDVPSINQIYYPEPFFRRVPITPAGR
jgi:hypothetical protein